MLDVCKVVYWNYSWIFFFLISVLVSILVIISVFYFKNKQLEFYKSFNIPRSLFYIFIFHWSSIFLCFGIRIFLSYIFIVLIFWIIWIALYLFRSLKFILLWNRQLQEFYLKFIIAYTPIFIFSVFSIIYWLNTTHYSDWILNYNSFSFTNILESFVSIEVRDCLTN